MNDIMFKICLFAFIYIELFDFLEQSFVKSMDYLKKILRVLIVFESNFTLVFAPGR